MPHPDGAAIIMLFRRRTYLKIVNDEAKVPLPFTAKKVVMLSLLLRALSSYVFSPSSQINEFLVATLNHPHPY